MTFRKYLESLSNIKDQDNELLDSIGDPYKLDESSTDKKCFFCSELKDSKVFNIYDPNIKKSARFFLIHEIKTKKCIKIYENLDKTSIQNEIDYLKSLQSYSKRLTETIKFLNSLDEDDIFMNSLFLNYDV